MMCSDFPSFSFSSSHLSLTAIVPEVMVSACVSVCVYAILKVYIKTL